ncbi:hypothetical protein GQ42DRAFT_173528 [Ramicandelaber brevisporus]|nr:hypothetical protein GQ42DRAFT_173528 [Ramicandelaber brevisporus]
MKTAQGYLTCNAEGIITGKFTAEDHPVEAMLKLVAAPAHTVFGKDATLEYEDLKALCGSYHIGPGSTIGPNELCFSLFREGEDDGHEAKVKLKSHIEPSLPLPLTEHGEACFKCE